MKQPEVQMNPHEAHMIVVESELLILRGMCVGALDRRVWKEGVDTLSGYAFQDNLHQVIFDTLSEMNTDDPRIIQGLLPSRLTIKGFPDLDLTPFFTPHNLRALVLVAMMHSVCGLARRRAQRDAALARS